MKINVFNICLMILNTIFWILIVAGALWLIFLALTSIFIISAHGFQVYKTIGLLALYAVIYTVALLSVVRLKRHLKKQADKKDGKEFEEKPLNLKKETIFWVSLCFGLIIASVIAALWTFFALTVTNWFYLLLNK